MLHRYKRTCLIAAIVALCVMMAGEKAEAGALRYFMRGGARTLAMGGMPSLATGVSDYLPEHPAVELDRPDFGLRFSAEYEDIARTVEDGSATADVNARAGGIELVMNEKGADHRLTFIALFRNETASTLDISNDTYIRTSGDPRIFSGAIRIGRLAIGAGHGESEASLEGCSEYLKQEIFESSGAPVYTGETRQPEDFVELAYIHSDDIQFFYRRSWAEKEMKLAISGNDPSTGAWQLEMPWELRGGGRSAGAVVEISERAVFTLSDTRYYFYGRDASRLTYSGGAGLYDPFGTHRTAMHSKSTAASIDYRKSSATTLRLGFTQSRMDLTYDGKFISVPTGFYDVEGGVYLKPALFNIGMEKRGAFYGTTFRAGLQYGELHPGGGVSVSGNTCPFLIDCKQTAYDEWLVPYTSVTQRALTMGFERSFGRFTMSYSLGQMFPKANRRPDDDSPGGTHDGDGIRAKGKEGRGGTLHLFSVETSF